jgi:peptide/nickel transport system permease protein
VINYIIRRVLQSIPLLLVATVLVFLMLRLLPGDPAIDIAGTRASQETIQALRAQMGLDKPLPVQYIIWMGHLLQGDMGRSYINNFPVSYLLVLKFKATLQLVGMSFVLAMLISFPLGILAALRHGSTLDRIALVFSGLGIAVPPYWSGILLVLVFAVGLGWLPSSGFAPPDQNLSESLRFSILPVLTMGVEMSAIQIRFMRSSFLDVLNQDYITTARAKGIHERRVVLVHALKNAFISVVTVLGLQLGTFLGGAAITEALFGWPGLGRLLLDSITQRDYNVVQGAVLFFLVIFIVVNLIVDVSYAWLDPRISNR